MEKKKSKKELMLEAQKLADKQEGVTKEHVSGMALIEELFTEYDTIELEQLEVLKEIKNK